MIEEIIWARQGNRKIKQRIRRDEDWSFFEVEDLEEVIIEEEKPANSLEEAVLKLALKVKELSEEVKKWKK